MVPRPTNAPRAFAPREIRSAQGSAATGRHETVPGAIKLYSDPYTYNDSSPLPDPEPVQPQRQTTPRNPAADDNMVETPVGEKQGTVDPNIEAEIVGAAGDIAGKLGASAALPTLAGTLAGYSFSDVLPFAIGNALAGAPQTAALGLGLRAIDQGLPSLYAKARQMLDDRATNRDSAMDGYRDSAGNINYQGMDEDRLNQEVDRLANYIERSRPLTDYAKDFGKAALNELTDIDNPRRGMFDQVGFESQLPGFEKFGFYDQQGQKKPEGLPDMALDEQTPSFALSDYDYDPSASHKELNAQMKAGEEARRQFNDAYLQKELADTRRMAEDKDEAELQDALDFARNLVEDKRDWERVEAKKQDDARKEAEKQQRIAESKNIVGGVDRYGYAVGAGIGSEGHISSGGRGTGGLNDSTVSRDYSGNSNPGGFSKASGGSAGGGMSNGRGRN